MGLLVSYALIAIANESEIAYPVAELGNCKDKKSCFAHCDIPDNYKACFAFAKKHNLLEGPLAEKGEVELEKFAEVIQQGGPGGCKSQTACENYCNDISRINECLAFAEEHGFMSDKELAEAKKVRAAIEGGAKLPGGCRNKSDCERYCQNGSHIDECVAFAEKAGFMPKEEVERAKKFAELMKTGETPGNCRSGQECERYCAAEDRMEECFAFAEKAGLVKPEEAEMFRKTGGKGPGGCRGRACEIYCDSPAHQEECFNWAKEHGFLKEKDLQRAREGAERFRRELRRLPPEASVCLKETVGAEVLDKLQNGEFVPTRDLGEKMKSCFEKEFQARQTDRQPENFNETQFPPEAAKCVKAKMENLTSRPTPEMERQIRSCFEILKSDQQQPNFPGESFQEYRETDYNVPLKSYPANPGQFQREYPGRFEEEYRQKYEEEYQRQYKQIQQQYPQPELRQPQSDYYHSQPPSNFPTNPEDFCRQYPEECKQIQLEYESQPQSYYPTLEEFLLGTLLIFVR